MKTFVSQIILVCSLLLYSVSLLGSEDNFSEVGWSCSATSPRGFWMCWAGDGPYLNQTEAEDAALRSCEINCPERCVIDHCMFTNR